jgi:hypothetical protein
MDIKIRNIVTKSAGIYFIVTDNSQVATIESESKMRLFFINVKQGGVNALYQFAKGDITGFQSIFGKASRDQEKKGNFSHQTCIDALRGGPIAVINLRSFNDLDVVGGFSVNPNGNETHSSDDIRYDTLFTTNSFWVPNKGQLVNVIAGSENDVLQFANIGTTALSLFVVKSKNYASLTAEGDLNLENTTLEIDEFPALNFQNTLLKDTFVDVYVFANSFDPATVNTNPYYGHLFDAEGRVNNTKLEELSQIKEAGFLRTFTGSIIPGLKNETNDDISIDVLINQYYMSVGLLANINEEVFERTFDQTTEPFIDIEGVSLFNKESWERLSGSDQYIYSHYVPETLSIEQVPYPPVPTQNSFESGPPKDLIEYEYEYVSDNQFIVAFESGIRIGDNFVGANNTICTITGIELLDPVSEQDVTYTPAIYTVQGTLLPVIRDNGPEKKVTKEPKKPKDSTATTASTENAGKVNFKTCVRVNGKLTHTFVNGFQKGTTLQIPLVDNDFARFDLDEIYINGNKVTALNDLIYVPNIREDSTLTVNLIPEKSEHRYFPKLVSIDDCYSVTIKPKLGDKLLFRYIFWSSRNKEISLTFPEQEFYDLNVNSVTLNHKPVKLHDKTLTFRLEKSSVIYANLTKKEVDETNENLVPVNFKFNLDDKKIDYKFAISQESEVYLTLPQQSKINFDTNNILIDGQILPYIKDSGLIDFTIGSAERNIEVNCLRDHELPDKCLLQPQGTSAINISFKLNTITALSYVLYTSNNLRLAFDIPSFGKSIKLEGIKVNGKPGTILENKLYINSITATTDIEIILSGTKLFDL